MNELIGRYRQAPEFLEKAVTGVTEEEASYAPQPGKWNIRQILRHLADTEIIAGGRFRQMIAEDNPPITAFKQDAWAEKLFYKKAPVEDSLAKLRMLRIDNADLLEESGESALDRTGTHAQRGPITVRQMLELFTGHVDRHIQQIEAIRTAWKSR